jgi:dihydrofolate synthase/folylpolyglutamate synthase
VPVVTGVVQPEAAAVLECEAAAMGAPLYRLGKDFAPERVAAGQPQVFGYRGRKRSFPCLEIGMIGRYQIDNACLAMAAMEILQEAGLVVDQAAMRRGLAQTRWEGRLERVALRPDIFLDGAHNPASAAQLAAAVREMKPSYRSCAGIESAIRTTQGSCRSCAAG